MTKLSSLILIALILTNCGSESSSSPEAGLSQEPTENAPEAESSPMGSVFYAKKSDLPECSDANESQLAYIRSEDVFYHCEGGDWLEADIQGKDGINGVTTEIEATNKKNQWVDPITGLSWLLGGSGNYATAKSSCSSPYRLPTWSEAQAGIAHGVRAIGASIPTSTQNFWIDLDNTNPWYATETSGAANKFQVFATANYQIFCVK